MNEYTVNRRKFSGGLVAAAGSLVLPQAALALAATPAQVEGPFHPIEPQFDTDMDLTLIDGRAESALGESILVQGRIMDASGSPLSNALVDVWQANHYGRYSHPVDPNTAQLDPNFQGWGLLRTDSDGRYRFKTIKPGAYPLSFLGGSGIRCQHIHFKVSHPDQDELITQMYFEGDPLIAQDQEIAKAPEELRHLLIAQSIEDEASGLPLYTFDVVLA